MYARRKSRIVVATFVDAPKLDADGVPRGFLFGFRAALAASPGVLGLEAAREANAAQILRWPRSRPKP